MVLVAIAMCTFENFNFSHESQLSRVLIGDVHVVYYIVLPLPAEYA